MRIRFGKPFWLSRRDVHAPAAYPTLRGIEDADVAVIGGGITGALAALAFAEAGVSAVVLEADRVARGSTAASSALLLQEPDCGLGDLERRYGVRRARRVWALSLGAVRELIATIRRHHIACDLHEQDAIFLTTDAAAVKPLRAEFERRCRAGFESEWLSAQRLQDEAGLTGHSGIRTSGSAHCDPVKACLGLLDAATRAGARIFERSRTVRIRATNHGVRVDARDGSVRARAVIVATGYATAEFRPLLGRFRLKETYALVTSPLDPKSRRTAGMRDVMFWDTARPYHYARWTPDRRLLLGGGDRRLGAAGRRPVPLSTVIHALQREFDTVLPDAAHLKIAFGWEGLFATTPDGLPYIGPHRRYPRHLFALGYGGNGMTFAALAARLLLASWHGAQSADLALFAFGRHRRASGMGRR